MLKIGPAIWALSLGTMLTTGYAAAHSLPIGDGNVAASPQTGNVFSCQTRFPSRGAGAEVAGDWFNEASGTWDPELKPIVDGSVSWPNEISITIQGDKRVVTGNGLPDHTTGAYPVARSDDAYQYDRNPNSIRAQNVLLRLDTDPQLAGSPTCVPMGMIGFATSGAAIYNALDALGRDAPAHEIQDACNGHPQREGEYHYHNLSDCLVDTQSGPNGHSDLLGYALDGFGIYGLYEANIDILTTADLDACHGHVGEVEWDGQIVEMYHYHFTEDYPYTLGCFAGVVTGSSVRTSQGGNNGPGMGTGPNGRPDGGPQGTNGSGEQVLALAAANLGISTEALRRAVGAPPPDFRRAAQQLGLSERTLRRAIESARRQVGF